MSTAAGSITNVVIAGLGGQGVLTASDILAEAAFLAGLTVKKAEVHGMSQRGGSIASDIRFAPAGEGLEFSPMIPGGEADYLVIFDSTQVEVQSHRLREGGTRLTPEDLDLSKLPNKRSLNVAMLGALGASLDIEAGHFITAIETHMAPKLHDMNRQAFAVGREQVK